LIFLSLWDILIERFSYFGEAPLCNLNPESTFTVFGFTFFLCYRCLFIIVGLLATSILYPKSNKWMLSKRIQPIVGILLILPTAIDGILQYGFLVPSNNFLRISTGTLAGIGFGLLVEWIFRPKKRLH